MKILIFVNTATNLLGFRYEFLKALIKNGYDVTAAAPFDNPNVKEKMAEIGVKFETLPLKKTSLNPFGDILTFASIIKTIKNTRPDIVFSFMIKPVIYASIAAKLCGVKHIQAMIEGLGYVFIGQSFRRKILRFFVSKMYKTALACADRVYFLNLDDKKYFEENIVAPTKTKRIFGIGTDLKKFPAQPPRNGNPVFLYVGRLLIDKGVRDFMQAAEIVKKQYPSAQFVMVGGLDSNPACIKTEEVENCKSIIYKGVQSDIPSFLSECTALVLPSYREGMPVSVSEAMASARAVIVSNVAGCRELIVKKSDTDAIQNGILEGKNGYLVEVRNPEAIAKAAIDIIQNREKAVEMGKTGRKFAEDVLDKEIINRILIEDIEEFR